MTPKDMCDALEAGTTMDMIAKRIGKTKSAVSGAIYRYRKANGLPPMRGDISKNVKGVKKTIDHSLNVLKKNTKKPMAKRSINSLLEVLEHDTCRFIDGDVRDGSAVFCQNDKKPGSSYCESHHARCYKPLKKQVSHGQD